MPRTQPQRPGKLKYPLDPILIPLKQFLDPRMVGQRKCARTWLTFVQCTSVHDRLQLEGGTDNIH